jgi:hypothetical protein
MPFGDQVFRFLAAGDIHRSRRFSPIHQSSVKICGPLAFGDAPMGDAAWRQPNVMTVHPAKLLRAAKWNSYEASNEKSHPWIPISQGNCTRRN